MYTFFFTKIIPSEDVFSIESIGGKVYTTAMMLHAIDHFTESHSEKSGDEILTNLYAI